jgi:hypothetical protein
MVLHFNADCFAIGLWRQFGPAAFHLAGADDQAFDSYMLARIFGRVIQHFFERHLFSFTDRRAAFQITIPGNRRRLIIIRGLRLFFRFLGEG